MSESITPVPSDKTGPIVHEGVLYCSAAHMDPVYRQRVADELGLPRLGFIGVEPDFTFVRQYKSEVK